MAEPGRPSGAGGIAARFPGADVPGSISAAPSGLDMQLFGRLLGLTPQANFCRRFAARLCRRFVDSEPLGGDRE